MDGGEVRECVDHTLERQVLVHLGIKTKCGRMGAWKGSQSVGWALGHGSIILGGGGGGAIRGVIGIGIAGQVGGHCDMGREARDLVGGASGRVSKGSGMGIYAP